MDIDKHLIVQVKKDSESSETITTLYINTNYLIKDVKEQIETQTGIDKATQRLLLHSFAYPYPHLSELHGNGKVSKYYIKHGSTLVLRYKPPPSAYPPRPLSKTKVKKHVNKAMHRCAGPGAPSSQ